MDEETPLQRQPLPSGSLEMQQILTALDLTTFSHKRSKDMEQYDSPPSIAARLIWTAHQNDHVSNRVVIDLGCGTGALTVALCLLRPRAVIGIDVDSNALTRCCQNLRKAADAGIDVSCVTLLQGDVSRLLSDGAAALRTFGLVYPPGRSPPFEWGCNDVTEPPLRSLVATNDQPAVGHCVVMNPPFGTKQEGADMRFVCAALGLASGVVYSLHKTSTRAFVLGSGAKLGVATRLVHELSYPLPNTLPMHKRKEAFTCVDLVQFFRIPTQVNTEDKSEP
eukprot:TRINITY_DN25404_c0_g1_i1.p1 TRINITY_DN25404_c0_g1~~TRINITY_DN25404_c0_g1_i1.p1  ORF type:complete len:287 (+),score=27.59 TRINITY_DN25404_c0_g1_i1:27-863(+)